LMNQLFENKPEPQTDQPEKMRYGKKVFRIVNGISIEFVKKKKSKEDGTKARKKRKQE